MTNTDLIERSARHEPYQLSIILVTYQYLPGLRANVLNIMRHLQSLKAQLIIIDNSKPNYRNNNLKFIEQLALNSNVCITYKTNSINCRFIAYNLGLSLTKGQYICFRTDDDDFDESLFAHVIKNIAIDSIHPVVTFAYQYVDDVQNPDGPCRPLESVVFHRCIFDKGCRFDTRSSADWRLLESVYSLFSVDSRAEVLFTKRPHGRPVCASL